MASIRISRCAFVVGLAVALTAAGFTACGKKTEETAQDKTETDPGQQTDNASAVNSAEELSLGKAAFEQKDYGNAVKHLELAADHGEAEAKKLLKTARLLLKAEQGDAASLYKVGLLYCRGDGVEQDEKEAVKWYLKAAELGYAEAQFDLGMRYNMGWGIPKDDVESAKWYLKAAEQGDLAAQSVMGNFYEKGIGVEKNEKEAVKWYRKAAELGSVSASDALLRFSED